MIYRIENSKEDGLLLWVNAPCGIRQPLIRWANLNDIRRFASNLLEYCDYAEANIKNKEEKIEEDKEAGREVDNASLESLLRQALGDEDFG
jgi:hypothetical protein